MAGLVPAISLRKARALKLESPGSALRAGPMMTFSWKICGAVFQPNHTIAAGTEGNNAYASSDEGSFIGARPDGCPHAYCGCGLRKYLGLADVRLNLAHNWARLFPREAMPRSGLAAVRAHHVMYIEAAAGNGEWLIRDYNSGGGLSRLHVRDLRGYVFVNPHG